MNRQTRRRPWPAPFALRALAGAALILSPGAVLSASGQAASLKPAVAADRAAADLDLPVRKIILYRSGVGYFERQGMVSGEQSIPLRFETDQVNDILKSMVLLDLDGGRINAVTYGSKEPLERRLRSFGVNVAGAPAIADLFTQLRGSKVRVTAIDGPVEGTILGVESRPVAAVPQDGRPSGGPAGIISQQYVNLVTGAGVRSISIPSISSFTLADAELNEELNKALAALAEQRTDRIKSVDLSFSGPPNQARRIVVSYVHEMPVWKTSYRLVLPDDAPTKGDPKAKDAAAAAAKGAATMTLQGWAIVENTTDQDWKDVRLSLASGRPVSFTMDLYQPLFTQRPDVPVPMLAGVGPRVYESAVLLTRRFAGAPAVRDQLGNEADAEKSQSNGKVVGQEGDFARYKFDAAPAMVSASDMANYAAAAQASAGEVGEQFMYALDAPVSLDRQRSAMLPILTAPIVGQKVSIYNATAFAKHPMRGVRLTNSAGLHLMPGPISVYDGAAYAGDAQIPHTSREQQRLLSYAVDLDVQATTEQNADQRLVSLRIVSGLIEQTFKQQQTTKYAFKSNDSTRGRTLLVEHPKNTGWDLIEPKKATETTESLYRFEVALEPGKVADLRVVQELVNAQRVGVTSIPLPTILAYAKDGKVSKAVVEAITKAAELQARVNELDRQTNQLDSERGEIGKDQDRLRNNMNSIDRAGQLYARYVAKLNEQESRLEEMTKQREQVRSQRDQTQKDLDAYLKNLSIE